MSKNYPAIAKTMIAPFVEILRVSREIFNGDIDRALIFYAIAIRSAEHDDYRKLDIEAINSGRVVDPPSLRTNARSIADSLGMPRESVRRKVQELINAGLVQRSGNHLMATGYGLSRLAPVRACLVGMSIRYYHMVSAVIAHGEPQAAAPRLDCDALAPRPLG